MRASGRLFWPVYYLIILYSIIFLYKKFSKKNSLIILLIIFFIQFIDIYPGLKGNLNSNSFMKVKKAEEDLFWKNITNNNSLIRTTYLNNETKYSLLLREVLMSSSIKKTDISTHGRYNRKQASISRSNLYKSFK